MKGLELARRYSSEVVYPKFARESPDSVNLMAFGLVGAGSECLGYDDEISRDHDWGPRVCIWIPEDLYRSKAAELQTIYESLDGGFLGFKTIRRLDTRFPRDGILSISRFYGQYIGMGHPPESLRDWLLCPETALASCTNGEVFTDVAGQFSSFRQALLSYFPRDVWLKKIASRCKSAARNGQYDLRRAMARNDKPAIYYHKAQFSIDMASLVFLLNRKYRPFAKWIFHGLREIGGIGSELYGLLAVLQNSENEKSLESVVDECVDAVIRGFSRLNLCSSESHFLFDHGRGIEEMIDDDELKNQIDMID